MFARLRTGDSFGLVARGAGLAFLLQVVGAGVGYLAQVLLARWMGAQGFGVYAYVMAVTGLVALPATLGLATAALRFVPAYRSQGDNARLRGFLSRSLSLFLMTGAVAALATFLFGYWFNETASPYGFPLMLASLLVLMAPFVALQTELARSERRVILAYAPGHIGRPLLIIGLGALWLILTGTLEARAGVLVTVIALALLSVLQGWPLWKKLGGELQDSPARYETRAWLKVSLPLLVIAGFSLILNQTDILMIGALLAPEEAGIYAAAVKLADLVPFALMAVNTLAAPTYAKLYTEGKRCEMQQLARQLAHLIFWPTLAIAGGILIASGWLLGFFGPEFHKGQGVLMVLIIGQLVNAGAGSVGYLTDLTGDQHWGMGVRGISAGLNIVLNALLIPRLGILGAALATSFTLILWNVGLHLRVSRRIQVHASIIHALGRERAGR